MKRPIQVKKELEGLQPANEKINVVTTIHNFIENDEMDKALELLVEHYPEPKRAMISLQDNYISNENDFVEGLINKEVYIKKKDDHLMRIAAAMSRIGGKIDYGDKENKKHTDFLNGQIEFYESEIKNLSLIKKSVQLTTIFYTAGSLIYFIANYNFYTIHDITLLSISLNLMFIFGGIASIKILNKIKRRFEINIITINYNKNIQ